MLFCVNSWFKLVETIEKKIAMSCQELESLKASVQSSQESLTRELEDKSKLQLELAEARSDLAKAGWKKLGKKCTKKISN